MNYRWQDDPRTKDPRNLALLAERIKAHNAIEGPRVGDWVRRPDGKETRITYIWKLNNGTGSLIQDGGLSGFHIDGSGYESYSGSLDPNFPATLLTPTEETKPGAIWFFDHDWPRADGGVGFMIEERVYILTSDPRNI